MHINQGYKFAYQIAPIDRKRKRHRLNFFFYYFITPLREIGSPYLGKDTTAARAALPVSNRACGIFVCPDKGVAANVWDL